MEDRLPNMSTKFAPRRRARAIRKSKSLKYRGFGALLEVELDKIGTTPPRANDLEISGHFWWLKVCFVWQAKGFRYVAKYVVDAGVREGCKNFGRRGGFKEGLK